MTRLILVEPYDVLREGLIAVLDDEPSFEVLGGYPSAEAALKERSRLKPDVVILEARLTGLSGSDAITVLRERFLGCRVIVITSQPTEAAMLSALAAGASGYVIKESNPTVLRQAVRAVVPGGVYIDPRVADLLVALALKGKHARGSSGLTLQQLRVLERLPKGLTNGDIARQLGVTEQTVKTHVRNIIRKLGVKDRSEAAAVALREGLG